MSVPGPLDLRLWPTRGVWRLIGEVLFDLLLLPWRALTTVLCARSRQREIAKLILGAEGEISPPSGTRDAT